MKPKPKEWTEAEEAGIDPPTRDGTSMGQIKAKLKRHAGPLKRMAHTMTLDSGWFPMTRLRA